MRESDLDECRWRVFNVPEMLQVRECLRHSLRGWRDERSLAQRAAAGPNPVLRRPQFSGREPSAPGAVHQFAVNLPDEAQGNRDLGETLQSMVHCANIVDDFGHVGGRVRIVQSRLSGEEVLQRALCPLDLARKHGLLPHIHEDKQVRIGQGQHGTIEPAKRIVRFGKQVTQMTAEIHWRLRRQRGRNEGTVPRGLRHISACPPFLLVTQGCHRWNPPSIVNVAFIMARIPLHSKRTVYYGRDSGPL